jgi:hypothetical protein
MIHTAAYHGRKRSYQAVDGSGVVVGVVVVAHYHHHAATPSTALPCGGLHGMKMLVAPVGGTFHRRKLLPGAVSRLSGSRDDEEGDVAPVVDAVSRHDHDVMLEEVRLIPSRTTIEHATAHVSRTPPAGEPRRKSGRIEPRPRVALPRHA